MPLAEAGRRRNRAADQVDELAGALERLLAAAADDRAGDRPREALLAVAAEDRRASSRSDASLTSSRRGEVGRRVHPHVERRVDRVGEAALGPVELHRRDAEVEQDRVRLHVVRGQLAEDGREVAAEKSGL